MYKIIARIYAAVRPIPILGGLAEALRQRRIPLVSTLRQRLVEQHSLLEAYGHALSGLRQAGARHEARLRALEAEIYKQAHHANQRLDAELLKQAHHFNLRFDAQHAELQQRIEFIRTETLLEQRYPAATPASARPASHSAARESRILNPDKLDAQRSAGGIRLNVGCGHKPDPARLNVDMRELPGVDIVASAQALPFQPGEVQEIHSAHVLEHFPEAQLRRQILPLWVGLLAPGGCLSAVVPDAEAMLDAYARGEIDFGRLRLITFGGQEYEGDFHHTMFTPDSLAQLFTEQGLVEVRVLARGRPCGDCLEFEIVGVKP